MNIKKLLVDFAAVFAASLIVSVLVTLLWNLTIHGASTIDWETSFRFAILLGIILPWMETRRHKGK
jgi:cellobiose-specific phosphotransferase system component IIC